MDFVHACAAVEDLAARPTLNVQACPAACVVHGVDFALMCPCECSDVGDTDSVNPGGVLFYFFVSLCLWVTIYVNFEFSISFIFAS